MMSKASRFRFRVPHFKLPDGSFDRFTYWGRTGRDEFSGPSQDNFTRDGDDEQSTGLVDGNGVEIFEGDVVRFWCDGRAAGGPFSKHKVITWRGGHAAGFSAVDADGSDPFSVMWSCEYGGREVIGNIHENPELLEAQ